MEIFLPSEVARLVLGYLDEENCSLAYDMFLKTSLHLTECAKVRDQGKKFRTRVMGMTLSDILCEYSSIYSLVDERLNKVDQEAAETLRSNGRLLDKITYLLNANSSGQTMLFSITLPPGKSPSSAVAHVRKSMKNSSDIVRTKERIRRTSKAQNEEPSTSHVLSKDVIDPTDLNTTPLSSLPGNNSPEHENIQDGEIIKTPKRKCAKKLKSNEQDENLDLDMLKKALLDNQELHKTIAENINKVRTPDISINTSIQVAAATSNEALTNLSSSIELDSMIKKVVHETESDPAFENFLIEFLGPVPEETSDEGEERCTSSISTPNKLEPDKVGSDLAEDEEMDKDAKSEIPLKQRLRNSKLKSDSMQPEFADTEMNNIEDQNEDAINSIIAVNMEQQNEVVEKMEVDNSTCTSTLTINTTTTSTAQSSSSTSFTTVVSSNISEKTELVFDGVVENPANTAKIVPVMSSANRNIIINSAPVMSQSTFVLTTDTFPVYQQPLLLTSRMAPPIVMQPSQIQLTQPAVISERDILTMPTLIVCEDKNTVVPRPAFCTAPSLPTIAPKKEPDIIPKPAINKKENESLPVLKTVEKITDSIKDSNTPVSDGNVKVLTTPRSGHSHVRALDFGSSPPKHSNPETKVKTALFNSPLKVPIATRTPTSKLKGDWDGIQGAGLIFAKAQQKQEASSSSSSSSRKTWDEELRASIILPEEPPKIPKQTTKKKKAPPTLNKTAEDASKIEANLNNSNDKTQKSNKNRKAPAKSRAKTKKASSTQTSDVAQTSDAQSEVITPAEESSKLVTSQDDQGSKNNIKEENTSENIALEDQQQNNKEPVSAEHDEEVETTGLRNMNPRTKKKCNLGNSYIKLLAVQEAGPSNQQSIIPDVVECLEKQPEKVLETEIKITPQELRETTNQAIIGKHNITPLLETPLKFDACPITPRFSTPNTDTPFTKMIHDNIGPVDFSSIPTPNFPVTPNFAITPKQSCETQGSYANRPTDYSTGSSYYQPSDGEHASLEKILIEEGKRCEKRDAVYHSEHVIVNSNIEVEICNKSGGVTPAKSLRSFSSCNSSCSYSSSSSDESSSTSSDSSSNSFEETDNAANTTVIPVQLRPPEEQQVASIILEMSQKPVENISSGTAAAEPSTSAKKSSKTPIKRRSLLSTTASSRKSKRIQQKEEALKNAETQMIIEEIKKVELPNKRTAVRKCRNLTVTHNEILENLEEKKKRTLAKFKENNNLKPKRLPKARQLKKTSDDLVNENINKKNPPTKTKGKTSIETIATKLRDRNKLKEQKIEPVVLLSNMELNTKEEVNNEIQESDKIESNENIKAEVDLNLIIPSTSKSEEKTVTSKSEEKTVTSKSEENIDTSKSEEKTVTSKSEEKIVTEEDLLLQKLELQEAKQNKSSDNLLEELITEKRKEVIGDDSTATGDSKLGLNLSEDEEETRLHLSSDEEPETEAKSEINNTAENKISVPKKKIEIIEDIVLTGPDKLYFPNENPPKSNFTEKENAVKLEEKNDQREKESNANLIEKENDPLLISAKMEKERNETSVTDIGTYKYDTVKTETKAQKTLEYPAEFDFINLTDDHKGIFNVVYKESPNKPNNKSINLDDSFNKDRKIKLKVYVESLDIEVTRQMSISPFFQFYSATPIGRRKGSPLKTKPKPVEQQDNSRPTPLEILYTEMENTTNTSSDDSNVQKTPKSKQKSKGSKEVIKTKKSTETKAPISLKQYKSRVQAKTQAEEDSLMNFAVTGTETEERVEHVSRKRKASDTDSSPEKKLKPDESLALLKKVDVDNFLSRVHGPQDS